jgi:hypothetical protein
MWSLGTDDFLRHGEADISDVVADQVEQLPA